MRTILLPMLLLLDCSSCTAALISMDHCRTDCDGKMSSFEMRGDENNLTCRCVVRKQSLACTEKGVSILCPITITK